VRFNFIDVILLGCLCLGVYLGYRGGVVKKMFNILALIASIVIAANVMDDIGDFLTNVVSIPDPTAHILGFGVVVLCIMTIFLVLYRKMTTDTVGKSVSQAIGMLLGLFESIMITSLVLIALRVFDAPGESTRNGSLLYKPLAKAVPTLFDGLRRFLPGASAFRDEFSKAFEQYNVFDTLKEKGKEF
jgi:uncharacterized membrane protein required for colicin V production